MGPRALRSRLLIKLLELLLVAAGIAAGMASYAILFPLNYAQLTQDELILGFGLSIAAFGWALFLSEEGGPPKFSEVLRVFFLGTGLSFILHAVLNYFQLLTRSFYLVLVGGLLAAMFLAAGREWIYRKTRSVRSGVVAIGYSPAAEQLVRALGMGLLGVVGTPGERLPAGVAWLGEAEQIEDVVATVRPSQVLVASTDWKERAPAATLLKLRAQGVTVSDMTALYERVFERVYCQGPAPVEMLLAPELCVDSRTMAVQAVYTNLIGLFFLILASPALILVSLAILLSGNRTAFDRVECAGFRGVPFLLYRFRTQRPSGEISRLGKIIARLHLVRLPQLINVVRGEMALVGPQPVRTEFAERLAAMMPFYSIRNFVKPGVVGHDYGTRSTPTAPADELKRIEYDLYYIKYASPIFDLEILGRSLLLREQGHFELQESAGGV
jgi:lipopolysaccharide/colanic/teichoic acid biosynthesis glycosyltransferase